MGILRRNCNAIITVTQENGHDYYAVTCMVHGRDVFDGMKLAWAKNVMAQIATDGEDNVCFGSNIDSLARWYDDTIIDIYETSEAWLDSDSLMKRLVGYNLLKVVG